MNDDPRTFEIKQDREGFFIEDEWGEEAEGFYCLGSWTSPRHSSLESAKEALAKMVAEYLDNYEPPDPPGWEGGFAENH